MAKIKVDALQCDRCTYVWLPRITTLPKQCPRCHSPYWNEEPPSGTRIAKRQARDGLSAKK